ncbi:MAG: hypothetical protein KKF77_09010 [Proteobacteria bacterium]|nr:hypothetical protein [Pseudomonadota bacterium]
MSKTSTPSKTSSASPHIPRYVKTPHHPVGLLYSSLHHGPHRADEVARRGSASIHDKASHDITSHDQTGKAARGPKKGGPLKDRPGCLKARRSYSERITTFLMMMGLSGTSL